MAADLGERVAQGKKQRLSNGKLYAEATLDDWRECLRFIRRGGKRLPQVRNT